jgi:hypothetical protein
MHPIEKLVSFPTSLTCTVYGWAHKLHLEPKMKKKNPSKYPMQRRFFTPTLGPWDI